MIAINLIGPSAQIWNAADADARAWAEAGRKAQKHFWENLDTRKALDAFLGKAK